MLVGPYAADARLCFWTEVEPGCLVARGVDDEQCVDLAQLLQQGISNGVYVLVADQQPDLRQERVGGAEIQNLLFQPRDRFGLHVGDDQETPALVGLDVLATAAEHGRLVFFRAFGREEPASRGGRWSGFSLRVREERGEFGVVSCGTHKLTSGARDLRVRGQAAVCNEALHILHGVRAVASPGNSDVPAV